jgi:hypothetical protein
MHKKMYLMGCDPSGLQVFSAMKYLMKYWPHAMTELYKVYNDREAIISWCTGFAFALALMEENGMPTDLDTVLHDWNPEDGAFHIDQACEEWLRWQ